MASPKKSDDQLGRNNLSNFLTKTRDECFTDLEDCLINGILPVWDEKANSELEDWIENTATLDVSLSTIILKLMISYILKQATYDERVVVKIYLKTLSISNIVADCNLTERYAKISFWESITELNMALIEYNEDTISREFLTIGLQIISIVVTPSADHFLRQLFIKSVNSLLEKYPTLARTSFKKSAHQYLSYLPACLAEVGDYDFQTSIVECIFRTTGISERKANINKIFPGLDLTTQALFLRIQDFDPDCRLFLNKYNEALGDNRLVFTFPCQNAHIGQLKLSKPKASSYEKFWVDFNLRSGTILIMCDRSNSTDDKSTESTWESLVIYPNEVTCVKLSYSPHSTVLVVELGRDPAEIFASPPSAEDLALLSEFFSIEFSTQEMIKDVCEKLYNEKLVVHDVIPSSSYRKVSKTEMAISSKAFSSSEPENKTKYQTSSSTKHCKVSKTKVPILTVRESSSSSTQVEKSSTKETEYGSKKLPQKAEYQHETKKSKQKHKISKTRWPIVCASDSSSANAGLTCGDLSHLFKETENVLKNNLIPEREIEASTSKENVTVHIEELNVSNTIKKTKKNGKSEMESSSKVASKGLATERPDTEEDATSKIKELQGSAKMDESQIETLPFEMINIPHKVPNGSKENSKKDQATCDATLPKKNQLEETKEDEIKEWSESQGNVFTGNEEEMHEESINDNTKIVQKAFDCTNDIEPICPQTPLRDDHSKSEILRGNSQNKLAEIISSVSPKRRLSPPINLEAEKVYMMPTQDQGFLLEAMDTLDDVDLNKDLSSTVTKLQNSEDEEDVDIESEEEIPSSIATPSAPTSLFNIKKNTELSVSRSSVKQQHDNVKATEQEKVKSQKITDTNSFVISDDKHDLTPDGKIRASRSQKSTDFYSKNKDVSHNDSGTTSKESFIMIDDKSASKSPICVSISKNRKSRSPSKESDHQSPERERKKVAKEKSPQGPSTKDETSQVFSSKKKYNKLSLKIETPIRAYISPKDSISPSKDSCVIIEDRSASKSPRCVSPSKKVKSMSPSKAENKSPSKDNKIQELLQEFENVLPSEEIKSPSNESGMNSPVRKSNKVSKEEKSQYSHNNIDDLFNNKFSPVNKYNKLPVKIEPSARKLRQSGLTPPLIEKKVLKAVVKSIESPQMIVDITSSLVSSGVLKTKGLNRAESTLEKSNREDSDGIMHMTSSKVSPTNTDILKEKQFPEEQKCQKDNAVHKENLLFKTTVTAEIDSSYNKVVQSRYSDKETILRYSNDIIVLDQIDRTDKGKASKTRKRRNRGLSDEDLMVHVESMDSTTPKAKSPRTEEDKSIRTDKTMSEGLKSTLKILETYPVNVTDNKFNKNRLRKEEKTPIKTEMKNKFDNTKKKNHYSPASNVTPTMTPCVTYGKNDKELKKTKKKLFNNANADINILQDTPPSTQSPDVEIASLYNLFNSESKSSLNRKSSKVNRSKDSSRNDTTDLSIQSPYLESTTHISDVEIGETLKDDKASPKQGYKKTRKSIRMKKEIIEKKSVGRNGPIIPVKRSRGRPAKNATAAFGRRKTKNPSLSTSKKSSVFEESKPASQTHSLYSDFSSEEEFGWLIEKKNNEGIKPPRIKASQTYGKLNWSYRNKIDRDSPEWRPVREKRLKKRVELPKAPTPPKSNHSTSSIISDLTDSDEVNEIFTNVKPRKTNKKSLIKQSHTSEIKQEISSKKRNIKKEMIDSDSSDDDIFKSSKTRETSSSENKSGRRITRSFLKEFSDDKNKQEISTKNKPMKRKWQKESTKYVQDSVQIIKSPEVQKQVHSWCDSISRPVSPELLRQNSRSSIDSVTPSTDFKLVPSGRDLEGIKYDISQNFGFSSPGLSSPEMTTIPEEPAQKRIRKSVEEADIKGLLEGILPSAKNICRNSYVANNTLDSGIYPLAPNNTPVSPVLAQAEESKRGENDLYTTDASDKEETQGSLSPRQSTMIDDLASKSLPSLAQFSYVSEQLEDSFIVDKSILKFGNEKEDGSKDNGHHASPLLNSHVNTKLQLSSGEDSPLPPEFLLPQQPWTPPMVDSDSDKENSYEDILNTVHEADLNQTIEVNSSQLNQTVEVNSAHLLSNENGIRSTSPELFSLETPIPLDNAVTPIPLDIAGTQAFSVQESGGRNSSQSKHSEINSFQSNEFSTKDTYINTWNLVSHKDTASSTLATQENALASTLPISKTKTHQLLTQLLDTYDKKGTLAGASQLETPTSHQNPLETPEVSQRQLFLNSGSDNNGLSDVDSSLPITPTRHSLLIQQMEEFKSHITVSHNRTISLWENMMKLLDENK